MTEDGVPIDALHLARDGDLAVVLAHGFTLSWQHGAVWKVARRLNRSAGVIAFDFRGHGRSGGKSTLGDREVKDLGVAEPGHDPQLLGLAGRLVQLVRVLDGEVGIAVAVHDQERDR